MLRIDKTGKLRPIKQGSTLPEMSDESGLSHRQKLIEAGSIVPADRVYGSWDVKTDGGHTSTYWERPYACKEAVERYKAHLIKSGFLKSKPFKNKIIQIQPKALAA